MNRIYRLVWSVRLNALVAVSEHARGRGKRGGRAQKVAGALTGAVLTLGAGQVLANGVTCVPGTTTISTAVIDEPCMLDDGEGVTITGTGSITSTNLSFPFSSNSVNISPAVILTGDITAAGINNAGAITATGTTQIQGVGIAVATGTLSGGITNSGTITSSDNIGIWVYLGGTVNNGITNSGTIDGQAYAISIYSNGTINGGITNTGTLTGVNGVVSIDNGSTLNGGFTNSGTINTENYALSINNSTVTGDIVNAEDGVLNLGSTGFSISNSTLTGDIINHGTINVSENGYGIEVDGTTMTGDIINTGTINLDLTTYDLAGIFVNDSSVDGSINNSGTIDVVTTSEWAYGIALSSAQLSGGIVNSGTISVASPSSSSAYGIWLTSAQVEGSISNTGTIEASAEDTGYGIAIQSSSSVAGISNSGTISASGSSSAMGIQISDSNVTGGIANTGTISASGPGDADGILITSSASVSGGLTNSGQISGSSTESSASGIRIDDSGNLDTISNTGTISGHSDDCCNEAYGIYLENTTLTSITNSAAGTISGTTAVNGYGLYLGSGAVISEGLTNSGTMTGTYASVMDNSGTFGNVNSYGLQQILVQGNNSAAFNGDVVAYGAHFIVDSGSTYSSTNAVLVDQFTVEADALFNMGVMQATGEFSDGLTVNGFDNEGTVRVAAGVTGTVTGDYSQSANAVFRLGLTDAISNYGKLAVSGDVTIADGSKIDVVINGSPSIANGTAVQGIITADGSLTVNPDTLTVTDNSLFFSFDASNERAANELDLITTSDPDALNNAVETYNNPAAAGVAGALTDMLVNGVPPDIAPVFEVMNGLSPEEASEAMEQMLPAIVGAGPQAGLTALHSMNKIIQSRIESNQGLSSGADNPDRYLWVRAFWNDGDQDDQDDISGFSSDTGGMTIGADAPVNDKTRAGIAFTFAETDIEGNSSNAPSEVNVDTYVLVAYASYNLDPRTDINVQFDVGQNQAESTRRIPFMGTVASADFDSLAFHGSAGIGRLFALSDQTNVTPSVRLDYTSMTTEDYTETGAGPLNLQVDEQDFEEFLLTTDAKFAHTIGKTLKLVANVTGGYDFINDQVQTTSVFTGGGAAFITDGLEVSPWLYRAGLGLINDNTQGLEMSVRYDMEGRSSGYLNQTLSARVRWLF